MLIEKIIFQRAKEWGGEGAVAIGVSLFKDDIVVWNTTATPGYHANLIVITVAEMATDTIIIATPKIQADYALINTAGINIPGHKLLLDGVVFDIPISTVPWPQILTDRVNFPISFPKGVSKGVAIGVALAFGLFIIAASKSRR